jgi:group II intron reverse transcriptase/maturase
MRDAETTLAIIEDRGRRGMRLERVYRRLFNEDLWLAAYARLAKNDGAMTRGVTDETVDGMSRAKIQRTIELLKQERYEWTPVRRILIPKGNSKTRPLGIPTWSDKLLQEVMRSMMEAYHEPQFSPNSHGFRPNKGCHTALKDIFHSWTGTKWFIEGDIKGCFDNIDHAVLLEIIRKNIDDGRFMRLVEGLLKAGYLEQWDFRPTLSGTPQGGIISPLLANIYLDKLDKFVENILIPEYTRGKKRKKTKEYRWFDNRISLLPREGPEGEIRKALIEERKGVPCTDPMDPSYRRLRYIRYADDFLLGFSGPRDEAEVIKEKIGIFLRDNLKLDMSPEKTVITHARTEQARFLGYDIGTYNSLKTKGNICLRLPPSKLEAKIAKYERDEVPVHRPELQSNDDFTIVSRYGSEYRGFVQYYAYAQNRFWLNHLRYAMELSMIKTLAAKHKMTVSKMVRKLRSTTTDRGRTIRCYQIIVERPGKEPLIARFGGISLKPQPFLKFEDGPADIDRHTHVRSELISRLLIGSCELCGSNDRLQVHHVRKLADLKNPGRRAIPIWKQVMIARLRKTLVVCQECHVNIHAGRPTRTKPTTDVFNA